MIEKAPGFGQDPTPIQKAPGFGNSAELPAPLQQSTDNLRLSRGYIAQSNLEDYMAGNQGGLELFGKFVAQSATGALLGTLESASYLLDVEQMVQKLKGDEQEYTNWLADAMKAGKQDIANNSALQVFQTSEAQTGFAPGDATWWAKQAPEAVGSILSLLIPASGASKVGGLFAKGLGAGEKGINLARGLSATVASRYAESTMEASAMYQRAYNDLITKDVDPETAKIQAGKQASKLWNTNWLFAAQDFFQYSTLLKGINSLSKGKVGTSIAELVKQTASEGAEEAGQYIAGEEAYNAALNQTDYFGKGFGKRLHDYIQDPEFKASTLLGAVGGGVFTGLGSVASAVENSKPVDALANLSNKIAEKVKDVFKYGLRKEQANYQGDTATSQMLDNEMFAKKAFESLRTGKTNQFKQELDELQHTTDIDNEARQTIKTFAEDLDFLQQEQARLKGSDIPADLHEFVLSTKLEQKQLSRLSDSLNKDIENIYQESMKTKELPVELADLKKLQVSIEGYKQLAKTNPVFKAKVTELEKQFTQAKSNPMMNIAFNHLGGVDKALVTSQDNQLFEKAKQLIAVNEKINRVKEDLVKTTTKEGLENIAKEQKEKEEVALAQKIVSDPNVGLEELRKTLDQLTTPEAQAIVFSKFTEKQADVKLDKQQEIHDNVDQAFSPEIEPPSDLLDPSNFEPDFNIDPDAAFDPERTVITPEFGGLTYNQTQNMFGKETADEFLSRLKAESTPEPKIVEDIVKETDEEAKTRLKTYKTVPGWAKFYEGHWENDKFVYNVVNGVKQLQKYWDNVTNKQVSAAEVFETDEFGNDIMSTPLTQPGDSFVLEVVDNGTDKQFKYTYTQKYRPDPNNKDQWVINAYRVNKNGEKLSNKPAFQLPSGDNKHSQSAELTQLRANVINSPNQRLVTTMVSKNIGDPRTTDQRRVLDILEFDYHETQKGNWVYGKTKHNPIFVIADTNGKLIAPNVGQMKGMTNEVETAITKMLEMPKPKGNVTGGIFTARMDGDGNFKPVLVYPRNLNETELTWLKDNLATKLADRDMSDVRQVYYIPETPAGALFTSNKKKGAITKADRNRLHIARFTEDNTELLIPVQGQANEKLWIAIQASGKNPQVANFMARESFDFSVVYQDGSKDPVRKSSKDAKPESVSKIYSAFDSILTNKDTSRRNIRKEVLNYEGTYTDPVTKKDYPTFYDFMKDGVVETDLAGSRTKGNGETSSYSFANARARLNPNPAQTVIKTDEKQPTVIKEIKTETKQTSESTPNEGKKIDIAALRAKRFGIKGKTRSATVEGFKTVTDRELTWFKTTFGDEFLSVAQSVDRVIANGGVEAFGVYHDALVTLAELSEEGTLYHEAFHFVFDPQLGLVSNGQREKILDEASKAHGITRSYDAPNSTQGKLRPVDYQLRAVNLLQSDKAKEVFTKGKKNNWTLEKIFQELQIPKDQQEILKQFNTSNREELVTNILANYSYIVEINTAKGVKIERYSGATYNPEDGYQPEEIIEEVINKDKPTDYYSNLTVPGGTNYTENEIATPAITPSIKGHAQFATDKGIGWFRSDEQLKTDGSVYVTEGDENLSVENLPNGRIKIYKEGYGNSEFVGEYASFEDFQKSQENKIKAFQQTKTRRILEVQSDLFQKGRDKEDLIKDRVTPYIIDNFKGRITIWDSVTNTPISEFKTLEEAQKEKEKLDSAYNAKYNAKENTFLQLLNKDNNWITFFVKAIIQDSRRKGYEKVLFPKGDTASKVEGHTTLEEFKKQKEDRLHYITKEIDSATKDRFIAVEMYDWSPTGSDKLFSNKKDAEDYAKANYNQYQITDLKPNSDKYVTDLTIEKDRLKQELERVEKEGFAALRPIYKFYEETVGNILKKNYNTIKEVKDEYGNSWYEVDLAKHKEDNIKLRALENKAYTKLTNDEKLEEIIAEEFRAYMLSNGRVKPKEEKAKGFFAKLWQAIKKLIGLKGPIESLFSHIANKPLSTSQKQFALKVQGRSSEPKYRVLPGFFNNTEQQEAVDAVKYMFMNLANEAATINDVSVLDILKNKDNVDLIFDTIKDELHDEALRLENKLVSRSEEEQLKYMTLKAMGVIVNPSSPGEQGSWEDVPTDLQVDTGFKTEVLKSLKSFGFVVSSRDITDYAEDKEFTTEDYTQEEIDFLSQQDESERHIHGLDHVLRNPNNTLSLRLKLFLSTIEEPNSNPTILGTPKYINFTKVMSALKARLANSLNPLTRLEQLSKVDPIAEAVFNKLSQEQAKGNTKLINEFSTGLNLAFHQYKTILIEYDETAKNVVAKYIETDQSSANKAQKAAWQQEGVRKKLFDTDGSVKDSSKFKQVLDDLKQFKKEFYEASVKKNKLPYEDVKSKFTSTLSKVGIEVPNQVFEELNQLNQGVKYNIVEGWLFGSQKASLEDFLTKAANGENPYKGTSTIADVLANRSKPYVKDLKGDTFMDEFNNQINPINLPSYRTDLFKKIKDKQSAKELKDFFLQDKFYEKNKFIALWGTDEASRIFMDFISASRINEGTPKSFEARTAGDSFIARITAFNNSGSSTVGGVFSGTLSDKSKQIVDGLPKKTGDLARNFLRDVLYNTYEAELHRIQTIRNNPDFEFPKNYRNKGSKFLYLPELNNIQGLTDSAFKGELDPKQLSNLNEQVKEVINKHIDEQYQLFKDYLVEKGVLEKDEQGNYNRGTLPAGLFANGTVDSVLKEFFFNDYAWRLETSKVYNGDIALYKDIDDYYKRGYQSVTPGIVPSTQDSFTRGIYKEQMLKKTDEELKELESVLGKEVAALYKEVNKTDAQSYINTATYRKLAQAWGGWSNEAEQLYEFAWKEDKTVNQAIRDKGVDRETGDKYRSLVNKVTLQVLKPFQFNEREITLPDGQKLIIKEQFKDSMMWLNPELTNRHTELKKMTEFMKANKIDVMSAGDTAKVGSFGVIDNFDNLITPNQKRTVSFKDIRFPQMMRDKKKEEITGTQFHKLVMGNLELTDPRVTEYNKLWEEKIRNSSDNLRSKLGLTEDWKLSDNIEKRREQLFKLKTLLENELGARTVNDNYADSLRLALDEVGQLNFTVHPGFPVLSKKFVSILTNLFKKNIIQQESPGFAMVNFADFGVQETATSSNIGLIVNKDGSIEAEIGMPVSFFRELGLNFKDHVDRTTNKIKWELLTEDQRKALQFILYRIPTSNKSSMIPVRVVMVLPESSGNVVMLPGELTKQQGLDFDVDKSQLLRRELKGNKISNSVDNKLFDIYWSILTEKKNVTEVLTPLDFDTIEAIAKEYEQEGIISSKSKAHFLTTPTDIDMEIRNKHGKRMIGIDSRANTAHAVLQTIKEYVALRPDAGASFLSTKSLGETLDENGTLISKNFGELQQSSLDNAKKPIKALLNVFPVTDPVMLYLTALGSSLRTSFSFINQPVIREWYKYFEQEGTADKALKAVLEAYPKLAQVYKSDTQISLSKQSLKPGLKQTIDNNTEHQSAVLHEFIKLQAEASQFVKLTNVLSVDTFSDMTGIEPLEVLLNQKNDLVNPDGVIVVDSSVFDLNTAPKEAKRIASFYKYGVEDAMSFVEQFAPYTSEPYKYAKDSFAELQGLEKITSKDTLKSLNTFLDYYVLESTNKLTPILDKVSPNYKTRWRFLSPEQSIQKRIEQLIDKYPGLKENGLIKNIVFNNSGKDKVQMIGVINTSSNVDSNEITKGWDDLFKDTTEEIRILAGDLVRFAIYTSGLTYNTKSFVDKVPVDFWVNSGLVNEHKILLDGLKNNLTKIDNEGFIRNFVRHHFAELNEVPELYYSVTKNKIKTTLSGVTAQGTHVKSFTVLKNDPLVQSARRVDVPTFTKIWDQDANKYRLYESSPSNPYYFVEVQPLGEKGAYWEVAGNSDGRMTSLHPRNKESGDAAPFDKVIKSFPLFGDSSLGENNWINTYIPGGKSSTQAVIDTLLEKETDVVSIQILNKLKQNSSKVLIPVETDSTLPKDVLGMLRVDAVGRGVVKINPKTTANEDKLRHALLHEIIHAYSIAVIQNPITPEEVNFARNITRVRKEVQTSYPDEYAVTDDYEFIAELASNKEFRNKLKKTDFWSRIVRLFRKLLGLPEKTDELLNNFYNVLDNAEALNEFGLSSNFNLEEKKELAKGKKRIDLLQQMLSSIQARIERLQRQNKKKEAEKLELTVAKLEELVSSNRNQAVVRYMITVQEEMQELIKSYSTMSKEPDRINPDAIQGMLEQLVSYEVLNSFKRQILHNPLEFAPTQEAADSMLKNLRELTDQVNEYEDKLKRLRRDRYAYVVYNNSADPNKDLDKIKDELDVASQDITLFNHWSGIGTDQRDVIVSTNHKLLRNAYADTYRETQEDLYKKDTTIVPVKFEYLVDNREGTGKYYKTWTGGYQKTGIYKALTDYETWLKTQGINPDSIADKFKPILDIESLGEASDGVKFISPASKEGKAILNRKNDDPLRVFYETVVLGYLHSQEKFPRHLRPGLRIPSIQRSMLEAVLTEKGTNKLKALSETAIDSIRKRYDEIDRKAVDEMGEPIKGLPVRFIAKQDGKDGRLTPRQVSLDVATTVGLFMNEAHLRSNLEPIISDLELGKGIAGERDVVKANKRLDLPGIGGWLTSKRNAATLSSGKLETIKGETSEAYKKVVQDLEMLAYGEYKKDEGDFKIKGTKFDIAKTTDAFLKMTGFNLLFGRFAIPLTNVVVGKITQLKESIGGNIISVQDSVAGEKFFATEAIKSISDLGLREKKTKFGKFFSILNPLDSERPVFDIGVSTNYTRTIFEKIVRSGGSSIEFYLGSTALGAVLNRDSFKAINSDGKKVSLYDAVEITDKGKIELQKGFTYKGKKELTGEDLNEIRDYTIRLYQSMNGVYNRIDSGNSQQYALGRAVMFMRRWLPEGINTRWRTRYFDPRLNKENEGHYVSALVGLNNIFTRDGLVQNMLDGIKIMTWMGTTDPKLLLHPTELELNEEQQSAIIDMRKANIRKTLFELYTIAAFSLLLAFGWDDEDDDSYVRYMVARVNREMKTFLSPSTAWDVLRSPSVAMSTVTGISKIIGDTGEAGYSLITGEDLPKYEQGDYKGQYKLSADIKRQFGLGFIEQFDNLDTKSQLIQRGFR